MLLTLLWQLFDIMGSKPIGSAFDAIFGRSVFRLCGSLGLGDIWFM